VARPRLRALYLQVLLTDTLAVRQANGWLTHCLHCRSALLLKADGAPVSAVTLEHIVPQSWFQRWPAAACCQALAGADDPRNLALACARCNHDKGKDLDVRGPGDARALEVVSALLARRAARWVHAAD
jgi:5-methylcytosine-specific restriction endonuclease McrA